MQLFSGFQFKLNFLPDSSTLPLSSRVSHAPLSLREPKVARPPVKRKAQPQLSMVWVKGEDGHLMAIWHKD